MAKGAVSTIAITDRDTIASADVCREVNNYATCTEALEKIVQRAARLDLHRMTSSEFEEFANTITRRPARA